LSQRILNVANRCVCAEMVVAKSWKNKSKGSRAVWRERDIIWKLIRELMAMS
jgi:hypothetical protein